RSFDLGHKVVPFVAVFAAEVHAADISVAAINQINLRMVTREAGIEHRANVNLGAASQIRLDLARLIEPLGQRRGRWRLGGAAGIREGRERFPAGWWGT